MATDIERLIVSLEASTTKFTREMERARRTTDQQMGAVERRTAQMRQRVDRIFGSVGGRLQAGIAGALAGVGASEVGKLVDAYTRVQNSLKVAGLEGEALTRTYDELFAAAQRQGVPVEALATLYGRLSLAQKDLGINGAELMRFTEGVATAIRISGQSATEASGALLQLSQALSGGTIQAEEYNSLLDGARPVLQAVAAGLKEAGGSVSKLTELVKGGEVSSQAFFRAFEAGQYVLDDMASKTVPTLSQGLSRVQNALERTAGEMNKTAGASEVVQKAIDALIADIGRLPGHLNSTLTEINGLTGAFTRLATAMGLITTTKLPFDPNPFAKFDEVGPPIPLAFDTNTPRRTVSTKDFKPTGGKGGGGGGGGRERVNEFDREVEAIGRRTRALESERATIGLSVGDTAKAEAAFRLLEAAKKANVAVTPELTAKVNELAAAHGLQTQSLHDAERAQRDLQRTMEDLQGLGTDALKGIIGDLRAGKSAAEAFAGSLEKIADKLLDMTIDNLFSAKGGNILGSLFGGGRGLGTTPGAGGLYAQGGYTGAGGKHQPAGVVHRGEYVMSADAVRRLGIGNLEALHQGALKGYAGGGLVGPPRMPSLAPRGGRTGSGVTIIDQRTTAAPAPQVSRDSNGDVRVILRDMVRGEMVSAAGENGRVAKAIGAPGQFRG